MTNKKLTSFIKTSLTASMKPFLVIVYVCLLLGLYSSCSNNDDWLEQPPTPTATQSTTNLEGLAKAVNQPSLIELIKQQDLKLLQENYTHPYLFDTDSITVYTEGDDYTTYSLPAFMVKDTLENHLHTLVVEKQGLEIKTYLATIELDSIGNVTNQTLQSYPEENTKTVKPKFFLGGLGIFTFVVPTIVNAGRFFSNSSRNSSGFISGNTAIRSTATGTPLGTGGRRPVVSITTSQEASIALRQNFNIAPRTSFEINRDRVFAYRNPAHSFVFLDYLNRENRSYNSRVFTYNVFRDIQNNPISSDRLRNRLENSSPCERLQKLLQDPKFVEAIKNLQKNLNNTNESGYYNLDGKTDYIFKKGEYTAVSMPNDENINLIIHSHPNHEEDYVEFHSWVHSPTDLYNFVRASINRNRAGLPNNYVSIVVSHGGVYALAIDNPQTLMNSYSKGEFLKQEWKDYLKDDIKNYIKFYKESFYEYERSNFNTLLQKDMLQKIKKHGLGAGFYKLAEDFTAFKKLSLGEDQQVKNEDCK